MKELREVNYFYKASIIEDNMSSLDKKRYMHYNRYGYNFGSSAKRVIDHESVFNSSIKHERK